ncbi:MAG: nuclear transport factor 2 family protein [Leptospirillia bacterium]
MSPLKLARRYMELVFAGDDMNALRDLITDDFIFRGPLYRYDSADEYIDAMRSNPLEGAGYTILQGFENDTAACLVYQFTKPGISTPMAQWFEVRGGRIQSVRLIFDSAPFT